MKFLDKIIKKQKEKLLSKAILKAELQHSKDKKKYFVLFYKNKFIVISAQEIRKGVKNKFFKKGLKVSDIEKISLHTT